MLALQCEGWSWVGLAAGLSLIIFCAFVALYRPKPSPLQQLSRLVAAAVVTPNEAREMGERLVSVDGTASGDLPSAEYRGWFEPPIRTVQSAVDYIGRTYGPGADPLTGREYVPWPSVPNEPRVNEARSMQPLEPLADPEVLVVPFEPTPPDRVIHQPPIEPAPPLLLVDAAMVVAEEELEVAAHSLERGRSGLDAILVEGCVARALEALERGRRMLVRYREER